MNLNQIPKLENLKAEEEEEDADEDGVVIAV